MPGAGSENLTGAKAPAAQRWCQAIGSRGGEWSQSAVGFPLLSLPPPFAGLNVRACVREGGSDLERGRHFLCKSETRAPGIVSATSRRFLHLKCRTEIRSPHSETLAQAAASSGTPILFAVFSSRSWQQNHTSKHRAPEKVEPGMKSSSSLSVSMHLSLQSGCGFLAKLYTPRNTPGCQL